ncbi:poly(ADP-ribose) glycohydrolase-like [Heptranchias perlo]|uniref:poly(ADP-ribose) glycohydrolase-like n=1 Tax=Heptranchias perlo TaxID=212740 RepID=UPI00355A5EF8
MSVKKINSEDQAKEQASGPEPGHMLDVFPSEKLHHYDEPWLGPDIQEFKRNPACLSKGPLLKPTHDHTICVEATAVHEGKIIPYKSPKAKDVWSAEYVKMPFSNFSKYTKKTWHHLELTVNRWDIVVSALKKPCFETSKGLENAILQYNQKYAHVWKFSGFHKYLDQLQFGEQKSLLAIVLPKMAKLALQLPDLCAKPIPLLKRGKHHAVTMSQEQIACLLANAFFCTFPHRNSTQRNSEYSNFPDINFSRLFAIPSSKTFEKLKTIFCYFNTVTENMPKGLVTFQRCCLNDDIQWKRSPYKLTKLHITRKGTIEEQGGDMLQVDFAAAMVGGGVLGSGLVQEEIRFLINTELIVARLFTEKLEANECLVITGAQRYSEYTGYSDSYRWQRSYIEETPRDSWLRRCTEIVAIDAVNFRNPLDQYEAYFLERELKKAFCGFSHRVLPDRQPLTVATGNWGCGVYKGDVKLKALIQIMAAAQAQKDVVYFTFGDSALMKSIHEMHQFLQQKDFTVGRLYNLLEKYSKIDFGGSKARDLYQFIQNNGDSLKGRI